LEEEYRTKIFDYDETDPMQKSEEVNKWLNAKTDSSFPSFISKNDIPEDDSAILLNALGFLGEWHHSFTYGEKLYFENASRENIKVPALKTEKREMLRFYQSPDKVFKMVEVPFKAPVNSSLSCLIFLPKSISGLAKLEKCLNQTFVEDCRQKAIYANVSLQLPQLDVSMEIANLIPAMLEIGGIKNGMPLPQMFPDASLTKIVHRIKLRIDSEKTKLFGKGKKERIGAVTFKVNRCFAFVIQYQGTFICQASMREPPTFIKI
jgi:serine protease inhibitor